MARRIGRILLGYLAACLSASLALHLVLAVFSWANGEAQSLYNANLLFTLLVVTVVIGLNAFLPALVVIILAERFRVRQWYVFTLAGGLAALCTALGVYLLRLSGIGAMNPTVLLMLVASGALAGLVYWAIAGRLSGGHPKPREPLPA